MDVKKLLILFLLLFTYFFFGCTKLDPKIEVPSYIEINNYNVAYTTTYNNGGPGTTHQKFNDVLVYANNQPLGFYPIPCKIPVLSDGPTNIMIKPVIKTNGVSSVKTDYPLMRFYSVSPDLKRGEKTEITPVFDYYSGVVFRWTENFENNGISIVGNSPGDTCFKKVASEKFEGNYALQIALNSNFDCTLKSSTGYYLPASSTDIFLELNYKADQSFEVGVIGGTNDMRSIGGVNASSGWNKIYMYLTPAVSQPPFYPSYSVYFYVQKNNDLINPKIYIDNIKLISKS